MSTLKINSLQIGQSLTAANNFTWYQPNTPDGTTRFGNGNPGSVTDILTVNSSGNVGIGTSSPRQKLSIGSTLDLYAGGVNSPTVPSIRGSAVNNLVLNAYSTGITYINYDSGTGGAVFCNGAGGALMTLDSSGNLGLGVAPSSWGTSGRVVQIGNTAIYSLGTGTYLKTNTYYDGSVSKYISNGYATSFDSINGGFLWAIASSNTAGNPVTFSQAMTLDANGRLGIGTSSPDSCLHITGNQLNNTATSIGIRAGMYGGVFAALEMVSSSGASGWIDFHDTSGADFSERIRGGIGQLELYTNGSTTSKAVLNSSGNFILGGHTSSGAIQKTYLMDMGTYYTGSQYLNYAVRIGRFTGGSTGKLHACIVRHGDYNYANLYTMHEISACQWGASLGIIDFAGKEMIGMVTGARWTSDSSKYIYFLDDMLWEQNGYLLIYASENFEFTMDNYTQASLSGLTWRTLTTTGQSWEVTMGT